MIFDQISIESSLTILTAKFTGKEPLFEGFDQTFSCNHASRSSLGDGSWPVLQVSLKWKILCCEYTEALRSSVYSKPLSKFKAYKRYISTEWNFGPKSFPQVFRHPWLASEKKIILFLYANEIAIYNVKNYKGYKVTPPRSFSRKTSLDLPY